MLLKNENDLVAALYSRVSTTEQAIDGYSIGEQERILVNYCESKGYKIYKSYVDPGYSGKDIIHRPAMTELLNDAKEKKFNLVISWKINRISRKLGDAIKIIEILEKNGIQYHSYSEPFENRTPAGKMQFQMMALVGEFERNTIAENVKMGMYAKARNGEWCGGVSPLGYDWELMEGRQGSSRRKSKLVINEKEAQIIRYFYNEYAQGKGYKTIVNKANKMGYRTKLGNTFSVAQLRTILMNPVYMGKVRFNVRRDWNEKRRRFINPDPIICDGIHEAIIDEELFGKVQYLIAQKNGKPSRIYDGEYPLTGILKCPQCGSGMVISSTTNTLEDGTKKRIVYYACGSWKNKGTAVCRCNSIRVDKANNKVFECLKDILKNENIVKDVVDKLNEKNDKKVEKAKNDLKHFENDIINIQLRKDKIFEAYEQGIINSD